MPGIEARLCEAAGTCVLGYVAASDAVLVLAQADDLAMETATVSAQAILEERQPRSILRLTYIHY
jgi:hypothetical protein